MRSLLLLPLVFSLAGCNWFNHVTGLSKESDKAIGAACRQTGRSLEACFVRNPTADRGQVFAGWREMQEYMSKQQLPTMQPPPDPVPPAPAPASAALAVQKTSDNGGNSTIAPTGDGDGDKSGKPDPEVQAVLDTINNRSNKNSAATPSSDEQKKLQQVLSSSAQPPAPSSAEPGKKKKG
jgi:hypothetical protein